jgi:hypothetical protein
VPPALSITQKSEQVLYSKLLLTRMMEQKPSGFQRILIGTESCLFLYFPRDPVWVAPHDEFLQHIKHKNDTEKVFGFDPLVGQRNPQSS